MADIFDALPGIEVPVGDITASLARLWEDTAGKGEAAPAPNDVKATQVNFVLHLGYNTTVADAVDQFQTVVRFSHRSPCRVVVLCPLPMDDAAETMRAKIYGECHLGRSKGDTRCCEFVMLSYPFAARRFLEGQLSVCLSADLPLFYWVHRFASLERLADYHHLLQRSERILIDSSLAASDIAAFPWPRADAIRDLVYARLLPVRQSIGQFLSSTEPAVLVAGLKKVTAGGGESLRAEAETLLRWAGKRLASCGAAAGVHSALTDVAGEGLLLALRFDYDDGRYFQWQGDLARKVGTFDADFGNGRSGVTTTAALLAPEAALSDAMFF